MQNLVEVVSTYVRETRRLESLPSSTEATFYPDLKLLLGAVLKSERLPFDVITGTSEGGARRWDMPDFVLGDSTLFVGVYGEVKRADTSLAKLAVSTEQNDQIGRYLSQTGVVLLCNVRGTWIPGRHPRRHRHHRRGEAFHDKPIDLYNGALDLRAASSRVVCVRFARDSSLEGGGFELLVPPGRRRADSEHFLKDACGEAARLDVASLHYTAGIETTSIEQRK
jgi:hypothetical protein